MEISDNVVYLAPCAKPFYGEKLIKAMDKYGKIKHMVIYGSGRKLGFPIGFLIGAIHFQKGYFGAMETSNAQTRLTKRAADSLKSPRKTVIFTDGSKSSKVAGASRRR